MARAKSENDLSESMGEGLRLPKLSHLVAGRLRDQIVSGKIKTGSQLEPENKLLAIFNVSRPTLREALRILEAESLIQIGRGMRSGATVLGPSRQKAAEFTNFMLVSEGVTVGDLHQARMFLEPAIIRSLDGDAVIDVSARLRRCILVIQEAMANRRYVEVVGGTNEFHEILAKASGNKAIALLVGILQSISDDAYAEAISSDKGGSANSALHKNMSKTVAGYDVLCDLLEKGKTEEAASFWTQYMSRAMDFLKRSKLGEKKLAQKSANSNSVSDRNGH